MSVRVGPAKAPSQCPLCREELGQLSLGRCHSCGTTFHQECLEEMGGCPTVGCAQRGLVPLDVERPSACPACGEGVPRDSYDCICGGRYHLECVWEGCIRPGCRLFGLPIGGRKPTINWRASAQRVAMALALVACTAMLYFLLVSEKGAEFKHLAGAGMACVLMAYLSIVLGQEDDSSAPR